MSTSLSEIAIWISIFGKFLRISGFLVKLTKEVFLTFPITVNDRISAPC